MEGYGIHVVHLLLLFEMWLSGSGGEFVEIEPAGDHCEGPVGVARPLVLGPVPIQFEPVPVGITEVESLTHAVVAGAIQLYAGRR